VVAKISGSSHNINSSSKYIKSAYFFSFCTDAIDSSPSQDMSINHIMQEEDESKKTLPKPKTENSLVYLVMFEQYINSNKIRISQDNKVKIKVYEI
jgi:hypothetical protein